MGHGFVLAGKTKILRAAGQSKPVGRNKDPTPETQI